MRATQRLRPNLVTTTWHGREKLHYLNPVPIRELADRWIRQYEHDRLDALTHLKHTLETTAMAKPEFVYTIYIQTTPDRLSTRHAISPSTAGQVRCSVRGTGLRWVGTATSNDNEMVTFLRDVLRTSPADDLRGVVHDRVPDRQW